MGLLLFLGAVSARAQGGPPMITDDPGTPGDKHWEINVADIGVFERDRSLNLAPYFDINNGVGDRIQLKVEGGYGIDSGSASQDRTGPGGLLAGVKWRFWDEEKDGGLSISMYPQFSLHPNYTSKDPEIAPPENFWLLPLEFSKQFGRFALNPEFGYQLFTRTPDSGFYGVVGDFEPQKDFELLAELHGDTLIQNGGNDLLFNIGTRCPLTENALLILSAGHTIKTLAGVPPQFLTYAGVQFHL